VPYACGCGYWSDARDRAAIALRLTRSPDDAAMITGQTLRIDGGLVTL
jgi:hypothetical protein